MIRKRIIHRILRKFFESYHSGERDKRDKYAAAIISGAAWTPEEKAYINMRKTVTDSTNLTWNDIKQYAKEHEARRTNKTPLLDQLRGWDYPSTAGVGHNRFLANQMLTQQNLLRRQQEEQFLLNQALTTGVYPMPEFSLDDEASSTEPSV